MFLQIQHLKLLRWLYEETMELYFYIFYIYILYLYFIFYIFLYFYILTRICFLARNLEEEITKGFVQNKAVMSSYAFWLPGRVVMCIEMEFQCKLIQPTYNSSLEQKKICNLSWYLSYAYLRILRVV